MMISVPLLYLKRNFLVALTKGSQPSKPTPIPGAKKGSIQLDKLSNWSLQNPRATLLLRQRLQLFFCRLEFLSSSFQGFFSEYDVAFNVGDVLLKFFAGVVACSSFEVGYVP